MSNISMAGGQAVRRTTLFCGALISTLGLHAAIGQAQPPLADDWGTPTATTAIGGCPMESRDGNELYTAAGSLGTLDIWVYRRGGRAGVFADRTRLEWPVSLDDADDFCPTPLSGNYLMFVSTRDVAQACGGSDIYLARYNTNTGESDGDAQHLACAPDGPNTAGVEFSPSVVTTSAGTALYYSSNVGGDQNIYRSEMAPDGSYGPGVAVDSLNTAFDDRQPNVSRDGLTIVFASNRDSGVFDIFMAERDSVNDEWSAPRNLSAELAFPTAGSDETRPSLSWDMKRLYYGSSGVIYVSERE